MFLIKSLSEEFEHHPVEIVFLLLNGRRSTASSSPVLRHRRRAVEGPLQIRRRHLQNGDLEK
jgi:hypothetical protein